MCVTTNNAELFFNALPIEKSYYFSSGKAAVRGTGKLSSPYKGSSRIVIIFTRIHRVRLEGGSQGPSYAL